VCGYALLHLGPRGEYRYLECGVLEARARGTMEQRLAVIARDLREVIGEFAPAALAVEDVFHARNARSALALAHARGAVVAVAGMAGLPVYSYAPAVVKRMVTGQGRASKEQVARMVQALVGLRARPRSDAADALAVALTHARTLGL
jgi:crossover junction endodeoxyribonuclease RuvC